MGEAGVWNNDSWEWDLGFNEVILNDVDALLLDELLQKNWDVKPNIQEEDRFIWWMHKYGFSVKDCYKRNIEITNLENLVDPFKVKSLDGLRKTKVPRKILIFS